jgi:ADP-ribose pyrophosphatase
MRGREYPEAPMVGVGVLVFDKRDRLLMIQRGNAPSQGLWALPGGLVEIGEEMKAAARREVREECGIDVEIGDVANVVDLILKEPDGKVKYHYILIDYFADFTDGEVLPDSDVLDAQWFTRKGLDDLDIPEVTMKVINQAYEKRGNFK